MSQLFQEGKNKEEIFESTGGNEDDKTGEENFEGNGGGEVGIARTELKREFTEEANGGGEVDFAKQNLCRNEAVC
ncbi:unnamed protein product [Cylicostephanus goldi]|uniref:Uncharacterized protein n=1 Tax=Cylicostephanus goldi TaxID=71465 RepID=A0A3P7N843_CYLGO|nr:unnamed protein product [Cylicostephanus goldi]